MTNATIHTAHHPEGYPVPIEEAVPKKSNFYTCPKCGEHLNPFKGNDRIHHYRHAPNVVNEDNPCPLATKAGIDRVRDEQRTSPQEKAEKKREFRVILTEAPGRVLELYGEIRTLEWDDIEDYSTLDEDLRQISIKGAGVKTTPQPTDFNPKEDVVNFKLDPDASQEKTKYNAYAVGVSAEETFPDIHGVWKADYLSDGEVFIGEKTDAERETGTIQSPTDEWVYIILKEAPDNLPETVNEYSLGDWDVIGFVANENTERLIREYGNVKLRDQRKSKVNIVLPPEVPPNTKSAITGPPGTEVLVGIRPPENLDPTYEVVSIPKEKGYSTIEPCGPGKPRLHSETIPEKGSRRVTVHQSGSDRHRLIHLHGDTAGSDQSEPDSINHPVGIHVEEGSHSETLNPLSGDHYEFKPDIDPVEIPDRLRFAGPDGYRLSIEAERTEDGDTDTARREAVRFSDFMYELPNWVEEGYREIDFVFDALGRVSISVLEAKPWTVELSFEEVKDRIRELDELPSKARWSLVREVYRAPKGTPHAEFPGGVKKQVRHAFWEVEEEREEREQ